MNSIEAAIKVLEAAGEPLHYKEITRRIIEQGLWETQGKTPEATVNANLGKDILKKGEDSKFQRTGPGIYTLGSWGMPEDIIDEDKGVTREDKVEVTKKMSFNDAAEVVLEESGNKQPMHYRVITDKMLELNLIQTEGKTPEATLYAQILSEIKRNTKRGETPRFVMHGKGYVGLQKWMGQGLAFQITKHNEGVRKKLLEKIRNISAAEFELLIGQLLVVLGFEDVTVTNISSDGGIDVRGTLVVGDVIRTNMAVQAKKWKNNVQKPTVQQVRGSLGTHEKGLIITTSDYSKGARAEAERPDAIPIALLDGKQLVNLLIENNIGVNRISSDIFELTEIPLVKDIG